LILGLSLHGLNFCSAFLPQNSPLALAVPLILIEIVSYLIRPLSLGIRLAANITAGHLLLNLGSSFLYFLVNSSFFILAPLPFLLLLVFTLLELAVAFIQSYVFSLLTALYINDSLELH
jgi:F-type H+-transporting ATPase subunit a